MAENGTDRVIIFPNGIPGFEEVREFDLNIEADTFLAQLEAVGDREIVFFLIQPQPFFPDYLPQVDLSSHEVDILEIEPGNNVDVWNIVTVCSNDLSKCTVNLRAPLIINARSNKGLQLILNDDGYSSRQPLFSASPEPDQAENVKEGDVG